MEEDEIIASAPDYALLDEDDIVYEDPAARKKKKVVRKKRKKKKKVGLNKPEPLAPDLTATLKAQRSTMTLGR